MARERFELELALSSMLGQPVLRLSGATAVEIAGYLAGRGGSRKGVSGYRWSGAGG